MSGPKISQVTFVNEAAQRRAEERMAAEAEYRTEHDAILRAVENGKRLRQRDPRFIPPSPPELPTIPPDAETDVLRKATHHLVNIAAEYKSAFEYALVAHATEAAKQKDSAKRDRFAKLAHALDTRCVTDLVQVIESDAVFAARSRADHLYDACMKEAQRLLAELGTETSVPDAVYEQIDALRESESGDTAQVALERIAQAVKTELQSVQAQKTADKREQADRDGETKRRAVAAEFTAALESIGYEVAGIDSTAFAEHGKLYAWQAEYPDHVVEFAIGTAGQQVISSPMRIEGSGTDQSEGQRKDVDDRFDATFCDRGIKSLKASAKARNIDMKFQRQHRPGEIDVGVIAESAVGAAINERRKASASRSTKPKLRTQNRLRRHP